jgi:hypothetical protein
MKYLAALDPQERIAELLDVEEPVRRIEPSRRTNRAAGIAVAVGVAIVGLGWGGHAWAPPAETDRGADSAAEVEPPLRTDGADLGAPTPSSIGSEAVRAVPVRSTPSASTDATLAAPGLSVTWSVERTNHGSLFRVTGSIDPGIARVEVRIEHGGHTLASATASAGLEDERTGTDGRPRGRARFTATLVVHGRLPASALRLDVGWGFDGAMGIVRIGWLLRIVPTDGDHVGLRTTPERRRR